MAEESPRERDWVTSFSRCCPGAPPPSSLCPHCLDLGTAATPGLPYFTEVSRVCRPVRPSSSPLRRRRLPLHLDSVPLVPFPPGSLSPHSHSTHGASAGLLLKTGIQPGNKMSVYFSFQVIHLHSPPSHT